MRIETGSAQHIGARHSQQDSFGFADASDQGFTSHGGFLAVVCDGMGGMEHGDAASRTAVRAFLDAYQRKTPAETVPDALERAVQEANHEVVALAAKLGLVENMGTTLVAAALTSEAFYYISVGDSGLFVASHGQLRMINHPHVFSNFLEKAVARGIMSREDAERHPERESLTSYIGAETLEEVDRNVDPWPLQEGDTILLASDGLFKTLESQEMTACLEGPPQDWPEALVERTLARQHEYQDNVTVLSMTPEPRGLPIKDDPPRTVIMVPRASGSPPALPETAPVSIREAKPQPDVGTRHRGLLVMILVVTLMLVAGAAASGWRWIVQHRIVQH